MIPKPFSKRPCYWIRERAELIDKLLSSFDMLDTEVDALWVREAEDRINAYEQGKMRAVSLEDVLRKYK